MYTLKIVANKVLMTGGNQSRKKFSDFNDLVRYVKEKKILISNPEILPNVFQEQLKEA